VFWLMTLLILVLFVTGLVIWDTYFFGYTLARHNMWNRDDSRWMGALGRVLANQP
jgi:cytochrome b subunit of formate dehydrogenase